MDAENQTPNREEIARDMIWATIHLLEIGTFPNLSTPTVLSCRQFLAELITQFEAKEVTEHDAAEG